MNASLTPKTPQTVKTWLAGQRVDRLDAELILSHVLGKNRTWLVAHDDHVLSGSELKRANNQAARRAEPEPLAYILGYKEFYGRKFAVTPDTLIPRPETEQLVEAVLSCRPYKGCSIKVLDVGCGSGCIGTTLKLECPTAQVTLSDISPAALKIARRNARALGANVELVESNLLRNINGQFDIIVANLPYVARDWVVSPETTYEPELALYAEDSGKDLIKKLLSEAPASLKPSGILALELDTRQVENITAFAVKTGHFTVLKTAPFLAILQIK
jgi:release factor glutamine methyltransferase